MVIAVIGPSAASPQEIMLAEEVGRLLAEGGAIVVCGGGGGVMEAVCRGASNAGGTTVGILPGLSRDEANEFVSIAIPTGMGEMRNALIIRAADAVIAIGGGAGTLSEIGFAAKIGKPIFGLKTFDISVRGEDAGFVRHVNSAKEAVDMVLKR